MTENEPKCVPLCGASTAYGPADQWWKHEPQCPVRQAHEAAAQRLADELAPFFEPSEREGL